MLKQAVAALLLANLGTALYTQGGLRWLGLGAVDEREPQRLALQLHPEQLQLLTAAPPKTTAAAPQAAPVPTTPAALAPAAVPAPATPPVAGMTLPAATSSTAPAATAPVAPATTASSPSTSTATKPREAPSPTPAQPQLQNNNNKTEQPVTTKTPNKEAARQPAPIKAPGQPEKTDKPTGQPAEAEKPATDKAQDPVPAKTAAKRRGKTSCWQASGYTPVQTIVLNGALDRVPELDKRWQIVATSSGNAGRWLVYQGGFASADALKQQRAEYKLANIDHRPLQLPGESGPGLVLGTYSSEAGAQRALQNAQRDGANNLRVVPEKGGSPARSYTLTLKAITEEEKALVEGLGPALAGKVLQRCR